MKTFKEFLKEETDNTVLYPNGVYIAVRPDESTTIAIKEYQEKFIKQHEINEDLHCTLIYSQKPQIEEVQTESYFATCTFDSFDLFGPKKDTLVLRLNSSELERRNKLLSNKYGFISDYDEYKPHITLAYGVANIDLNSLPPIEFMMVLTNEEVGHLDINYTNK